MGKIERKIGRHHLAFYRGWLQGVDIKTLADRYLETGVDLRIAKSTLIWIKDLLTQAALRNGKRGEARLLRSHLARGDSSVATIPSIDDFREENDPDCFYREEELIKMYIEAYPSALDKRIRHRQRLIERQLVALKWIEDLLVTEPVENDLISAWFERPIADRLILAGIATIGDLLRLIQAKGYRWWIMVPRLGEKGAARIISWLRSYENSLGVLPTQAIAPIRLQDSAALTKERSSVTAIVPMEAFLVPDDLSGESGCNRYPGPPRIQASNDHQAIHSWIATKSNSPNTARAYRKEAERLLLWAVIERHKALSDMDVDDCTSYRNWLSMIGRTAPNEWPFKIAQDKWIGKRNTPRFSDNWRPFDGPLQTASIKHALAIVSSFFEWLVRTQYLAFNPWDVVNKKPETSDEVPEDLELTRVFSSAQWDFLNEHLQAQPASPHKDRLIFVLAFAYSTGLRVSELVDATTGRIYTMSVRNSLSVRWMLKVRGKGGKWRAVPLPDGVVGAIREYLSKRGLNPDPFENAPDTPLIANLNGTDSVTTSSLYKTLRTLFQSAAHALHSAGHGQAAKDFERASVHWLRHTRGSHLGNAGVAPNLIQKLLGHASLATTSIYTESDDEKLWQELVELEG